MLRRTSGSPKFCRFFGFFLLVLAYLIRNFAYSESGLSYVEKEREIPEELWISQPATPLVYIIFYIIFCMCACVYVCVSGQNLTNQFVN